MLSQSPNKNNTKNSGNQISTHPIDKVKNVIKRTVKTIIAPVAIAAELTSPILSAPAMYYSATSNGEGGKERFHEGIDAPKHLWELSKESIHDNIDSATLIELLEKYNLEIDAISSEENSIFEKARALKNAWNKPWRKEDLAEIKHIWWHIVDQKKEAIETYIQAQDNWEKQKLQTLISTLWAWLLYAFLIPQLARFARLRNRDSLVDRWRKKTYNWLHRVWEKIYYGSTGFLNRKNDED